MKRFLTKKSVAIGVVAALLVGGGAAFAIATGVGSGSGSGSGAAGGPASCTVALQANWDPPGTISIGGTATIDFAAKNTGTQPCLIKTISAAVNSGIGPVSSTNPLCQDVINEQQNQFWLSPTGTGTPGVDVSVPQDGTTGVTVPANGLWTPLPNAGILTWTNTGFPQDACTSQPLTLSIVTP